MSNITKLNPQNKKEIEEARVKTLKQTIKEQNINIEDWLNRAKEDEKELNYEITVIMSQIEEAELTKKEMIKRINEHMKFIRDLKITKRELEEEC